MKKLIISIFALLISVSISAQFSVLNSASYFMPNHGGSNVNIFVIDNIHNTTELRFNLYQSYTTINWFRYENPTFSISNLNHIFFPDTGGYIIDATDSDGNTTRRYVWIFDYQEHLPNLIEFEPIHEQSNCVTTYFRLNANAVSPMIYFVFGNSTPRQIDRNFTITYNTREYSNGVWNVIERSQQIVLPASQISVPASLYAGVFFTLSGDQFAQSFGINPLFSVSTTESALTNIESRLTAVVETRDALNEINRPRERYITPPNTLVGSAPFEVTFQSRPSDNNASVEWKIYRINDGDSTSFIASQFTHNLPQITFREDGTYRVHLSVANRVHLSETNGNYCTSTESFTVQVYVSHLSVPNVFTPNNDGINDEFRVAFRSLESFHMSVFTDRGQLVFETTDPQRGWDGRIGNRNAPMGTYFYIIRARGTDGRVFNKRGDVALIRPTPRR